MKFLKLLKTFLLANYPIIFYICAYTYIFIILPYTSNLDIDLSEMLIGDYVSSENEISSNSVDTEILARRIGSGLATSGLGGVGVGIGLVFSGLIKGFSRNPSLKDELFSYAIFGFALTEAIGLFALMMAFMLLYA